MKRIVRTELTITHVEPKTNTKALDSIYDWTFYTRTDMYNYIGMKV